MADETRVQVLNEEGRRAQTQSFMWLFRSGEDGLPGDHPVWLFPDQERQPCKGVPGRATADTWKRMDIRDTTIFQGSDAVLAGRISVDTLSMPFPKGNSMTTASLQCRESSTANRLFAIEDSINKKYPGDYEKRKQLRLEKEKPVLEAFWSWLDQQKPVRNTRMDKAVNYVLNRRDTAETYLEDGRCSFTNNLSENAIRPFAVGRKNWLFSNSVEGANASAVVYTMVEMAKAHGLNIYGYLKFLLEHRPGKDMTDEQLAELAPWSEKLQSIKNRM